MRSWQAQGRDSRGSGSHTPFYKWARGEQIIFAWLGDCRCTTNFGEHGWIHQCPRDYFPILISLQMGNVWSDEDTFFNLKTLLTIISFPPSLVTSLTPPRPSYRDHPTLAWLWRIMTANTLRRPDVIYGGDIVKCCLLPHSARYIIHANKMELTTSQ